MVVGRWEFLAGGAEECWLFMDWSGSLLSAFCCVKQWCTGAEVGEEVWLYRLFGGADIWEHEAARSHVSSSLSGVGGSWVFVAVSPPAEDA